MTHADCREHAGARAKLNAGVGRLLVAVVRHIDRHERVVAGYVARGHSRADAERLADAHLRLVRKAGDR